MRKAFAGQQSLPARWKTVQYFGVISFGPSIGELASREFMFL